MLLEAIGLILAVIDFAGWSEKLEGWLESAKTVLRRIVSLDRGAWGDRGFNKLVVVFLSLSILTGVGGATFSLLTGPGYEIKSTFDLIAVIIACIVGIVASCFIAGGIWWVIFAVLFGLILTPLAKILHLMSKAPKGILGTIGLLIAVVSFIRNLFVK